MKVWNPKMAPVSPVNLDTIKMGVEQNVLNVHLDSILMGRRDQNTNIPATVCYNISLMKEIC